MNKEQYLQDLIDTITETENTLPYNERMSPQMLGFLLEEITEKVEHSYNQYIIGKQEDFILTIDEMEELFMVAHRRSIDDALNNLTEMNIVQMGVDAEGEIVYSLTEDGKDLATQIFGEAK